VMEKVRSSVDLNKEVRYRRVGQMAIWRAMDAASLKFISSDAPTSTRGL
jgi:hypothetical protein